MVAQVIAILALILSHGQRTPLHLLGQSALWLVVLTALASAAGYFRRVNVILNPRVATFSSTAARDADRKIG
jgi:hypothetical protein